MSTGRKTPGLVSFAAGKSAVTRLSKFVTMLHASGSSSMDCGSSRGKLKPLAGLGGGVESAGPRAASGYVRDCMSLDLDSVWHQDGGFLAFSSKLNRARHRELSIRVGVFARV